MHQLRRVVVVGASAAGLTVAETLRREGFDGDLVLIGDEPHLPYDRPPLSKQVLLGGWEPEATALRDPTTYEAQGIEIRTGVRASALDLASRAIIVDGRGRVGFDGLVIATGLRPARLRLDRELRGVHVLRTVDDAISLRADLESARSAVVVGAGVLGCEAAASMRTLGLEVTVVDAAPTPMARSFGPPIGDLVVALHRDHGTAMRLRTGVRRVLGDVRVVGVELDDGAVVGCDLLVVAIGAVPATAWLESAGLALDDGVLCDQTCAAAPGVYAAGDVARWHNPQVGTTTRFEHRMNATEQGIVAARNLLGAKISFAPTPYFWSDQYDAKIQAYGRFPASAEVSLADGDFASRRFVLAYQVNGRVTGVVGWTMPRTFRESRALVGERVGPAERIA